MKAITVLFCLMAVVCVHAVGNYSEYNVDSVLERNTRAVGRKPRYRTRPLDHDRSYYEAMLGLKPEEGKMKSLFGSSLYSSMAKAFAKVVPPENFSWTAIPNIITSVKQQGRCGSCYAFAALGGAEAMSAIWNQLPLLDLSEQQIIDCSRRFGNNGCRGGLMTFAYNYMANNRGIVRQFKYPYRAVAARKCKRARGALLYTPFIRYALLPGDEEVMKKILYTVGPLPVGVFSNLMSFFTYAGGIYDDLQCNRQPDHGVLLVGYGVEDGVPYWLIKNSWGTSWGENGYMKMLRGTNMCQVRFLPIVPVPKSVADRIIAGEDVRHNWRTD